uniref:hypothetical protein n=1 Tax=uncultured Sphingomonas sp. TaxID=158754 RepID=UPI0035CC77D5
MLIWNSRRTAQYNSDEIVRVTAGPTVAGHSLELSTVRLRDGSEAIVYDVDLERLRDRAVTVIPAQPGYDLLHFSPSFNDNESFLEPVIAWHITELGEVLPLTISGLWDDMHRPLPIRTPTGAVKFAGEEWPSVLNYIASAKRDHAAKSSAKPEAANG